MKQMYRKLSIMLLIKLFLIEDGIALTHPPYLLPNEAMKMFFFCFLFFVVHSNFQLGCCATAQRYTSDKRI